MSLAELVAATTPPRSRGGIDTRIGCGFKSGGVRVDGGDGREAQRSMARETYTKTFSGMQVYNGCCRSQVVWTHNTAKIYCCIEVVAVYSLAVHSKGENTAGGRLRYRA